MLQSMIGSNGESQREELNSRVKPGGDGLGFKYLGNWTRRPLGLPLHPVNFL